MCVYMCLFELMKVTGVLFVLVSSLHFVLQLISLIGVGILSN